MQRTIILEKTQLSLGVGFSVKEAENIKDSFVLQIVHLLNDYSRETVRYWRRMLPMVFSMRKKLVDKFTRNLGSALQTLDVEEIRNTINVIYNETMETLGVHGWEILEMIR